MKAAIITAAGTPPIFGEFQRAHGDAGSGTDHRQRLGSEPVQ